MSKIQITNIFRPTSFPEDTYVERVYDKGESYEKRLKRALLVDGRLIFISGASKSGKTVLCHKVIDGDKIIDISGSHIVSSQDFWAQIAEKINFPIEIETSETNAEGTGIGMGASIKGSIPFTASADAKFEGSSTSTATKGSLQKRLRSNNGIIEYLLENDKVLVIDDFHYIANDIQLYIARVLKTELFKGLRAVIISLPHRSDDAIRLNSDLIGRTSTINIEPWSKTDLEQIALKGFKVLGYKIETDALHLLSQESIASPQLMQENCLNLAFIGQEKNSKSFISDDVEKAFENTAQNYDVYKEALTQAAAGPMHGGKDRTKYAVKSGEYVDIYRLIWECLKDDPPVLQLTIAELKERMVAVTKEGEPLPRSITIINTLNRIIKILGNYVPVLDTLEIKQGTIYILDPFLLFYLRWH